jgi:hypothetical protein
VRTIARHDVDEAAVEKRIARLAARVHEAREDIEEVTLGPGFAMRRSLEEFFCRCATDPQAVWNDTWLALVRAMQSGAALFLCANTPAGEQVQFNFGDETIRRPATGPTRDSNGVNWLTAMWLAIICREQARMDLLAGIPLDLLRGSGTPADEFVYSWAHALQVYVRGEADLVEAVLQAMRDTEPEGLQSFPAATVLQVYYPPIELFYYFTQREEGKFNDSLANALELHQRYWTADDDRRPAPSGFVALAPLAIACLARDAGMTIDVESDYLPLHMLTGTRVGEITT